MGSADPNEAAVVWRQIARKKFLLRFGWIWLDLLVVGGRRKAEGGRRKKLLRATSRKIAYVY
jgi:hypothetical protein